MRFLYSIVLCFVLLFSPSVRAAGPSLTARQRFAGVRHWKLYYTYTTSSPYTWTEAGVTTVRHTWTGSDSGIIPLETESLNDTNIAANGKGHGFANVNFGFTRYAPGDDVETRYDRGGGPTEAEGRLEIDFETGTYHVEIRNNEHTALYGGTHHFSNTDQKYGPDEERTHNDMPLPSSEEKKLLLPESGRMITGSFSWEERWAYTAKTENGFDPQERFRVDPSSGTIRWIILPDDPLDCELIIEPNGYDDWIPAGAADTKAAGNGIGIKATLVAKGGSGAPPVKAQQMTFLVATASQQKGACLNYPLTKPGTEPDLIFEQSKNEGCEIADAGATLKTPQRETISETANLSSFDYGAYGSIMVIATLTDGRLVMGHLKDSTVTEVLMPKRSADSFIADAWKKLESFKGVDDSDDDKQKGNENPGDGLTAYEEYRGLFVHGKHTRTRPGVKDLVVINTVGEKAADGMKLFETASGIHVIEMADGELPKSRQVNPNATSASGGEQYALRLINEKLTGGTAGENRPADVYNKTPKKSEAVVIDLVFADEIYKGQAAVAKAAGETMPFTAEQNLANTIAHEMAHGVGAAHHGRPSDYSGKTVITPRMTDYPVYASDGTKLDIPEGGFTLGGRIGRPGSEASGDANCIMCYTDFYQWAAVGPDGGPYRYYNVGLQPRGAIFCTSAAGTGMNAPHKIGDVDVPGFFGNAAGQGTGAPAGNCLSAMKVRDW